MKGISICPGHAYCKAELFTHDVSLFICFGEFDQAQEIELFASALEKSKKQIEESIKNVSSEAELQVLNAHLQMVQDPVFLEDVKNLIVSGKTATKAVTDYLLEFIEKLPENIRDDFFDFLKRMQTNLGKEALIPNPEEDYILVCDYVLPSEVIELSKTQVKAIVCEKGSFFSHSAILCREFEIPTVFQVDKVTSQFNDGDMIYVNSTTGRVLDNKPENEVFHEEELDKIEDIRKDIKANVSSMKELEKLDKLGCNQIGLFRTEYLAVKKEKIPTFGEQLENYVEILKSIGENGHVIFRTFDFSHEKRPKVLTIDQNLRGIEFCLENEAVFIPQLKALVAASAFGNESILFPLVETSDIFIRARSLLNQSGGETLRAGAMIETLKGVKNSREIAKYADYLSIGSNDLLADISGRNRDEIEEGLDGKIIEVVEKIIQNGHAEGKKVGICGELASIPEYAVIFYGMGIDYLSMNYINLASVNRILNLNTRDSAKQILDHIRNIDDTEKIENILRKEINE